MKSETSHREREQILFFPAYGFRENSRWILRIRGQVTRPELDSKKRAAAFATIRKLIGLDANQRETEILRQRLWPFTGHAVENREVRIALAGETFEVGTSDSDGQFSGTVELDAGNLDASAIESARNASSTPSITFQAAGDDRFSGCAQLIEPEGISVISDIDDTVKITEVATRRRLLVNTFMEPFRAVPGMAEIYRNWAAEGAAFHFVSSSPWQLDRPLGEFLQAENFPGASRHLKAFHPLSSPGGIFAVREDLKLATMRQLLDDFPQRRFLLVGDGGQHDPQVYAQLESERPEQIAGILIRRVRSTEESDLKAGGGPKWQFFRGAQEIRSAPSRSQS